MMPRCCRIAVTVLALAAAPAMAQAAGGQVPDSTAPPPSAPRASIDLKVLIDADMRTEWHEKDVTGPGFGLRRVRLITQGTLGDRSTFRVLLEPSGLALGPEGAAPFRGVPLVEAVLDYRLGGGLVLQAGQLRVPFGLSASTVAPSLPTPEYPLATRVLIQRVSVFRDIGVALAGRVGALEYSGSLFNGAGINVGSDNNEVRDVAGRVTWALVPGWTAGVSAWAGRTGELYAPGDSPQATFFDDAPFRRWAVETRLARGPARLWVEYLRDRTEYNPQALNPIPTPDPLARWGWNLLAAYRLRDHLEAVGRYDRWRPLGSDPPYVREYVAGVQWYPVEIQTPADPRTGPPLNIARRHSRVMLFLEHQTSGSAPASTLARLRWQLFY